MKERADKRKDGGKSGGELTHWKDQRASMIALAKKKSGEL